MKNKGMWKLIGSLLVLFFVLLLITPNVISEAAERKVYTADIKYVNPLYADIISEEDLEDTPSVYFGDGEIEYHDTIAEAAAEMREQMEARTETIVIGIEYGEFIEDVAHYIFNDALLHTGVPTQGDYLAFTYGGWSGSLSGLECEDGYEITITYTMKYYTTAAQEAQMDIAVDNLLDELDLYEADDYSKVCGIYDYICDNVVYDYENLENSEYKLMYTAYAALMDKTAVCQGYANLLYRLALELDVDARIIAGDAGGPHAWNIVKLGNWYYNLDSTWDAGEDEYDYFLKNPEGFVDHIRREEYETEAFHAAYPMSEVDYVDRPEEEPDEPGEEPGDEPVVGVVINAESFPDTVFRQYVSEQFDTDADGVLSEQEADVFSIDVTNMGIQSLKGIEYFKTLVSLVCKSNDSLTALDVSQNTKLELLWCEWSPIGVLDVSNNPELQYLYCTNCELTELDVTNNPKLSWLHCDQNDISELDLRYNPDLEKLQCYDMNLTELDLSNNPKIFYLLCHGNELSELNVSNLSNLDTLWCSGNRLTQLDLSNNLKISSVRCEVNQLAELDVSMLDELILLYCQENQLQSIDVSKNTKLVYLYCGLNPIEDLDVSKNVNLEELGFRDCLVTEIDLSKNVLLQGLDCGINRLTVLDLSNNTVLESLTCDANQIIELDLSKNLLLKNLWCTQNQLTQLDVSVNTKLSLLCCSINHLTKLDVSNNVELVELQCGWNNLAGIDLSNNNKLETLICLYNDIQICPDIDLTTLPGFNPERISNWVGATYDAENGTIIDVEESTVTYTYDCGNGFNEIFGLTLITHCDGDADNYCDNCGSKLGDIEEEPSITPPDEPTGTPDGSEIEGCLYDAEYYAKANEDVAVALNYDEAAMYNHWINIGKAEGRNASLVFNAKYYLEVNPSVAAIVGNDYVAAYNHFINIGLAAGLESSPVFDVKYYLQVNADVAGVFGNDYLSAAKHFAANALAESRSGSGMFDYTVYAYCNTDVAALYGDDIIGYYIHYINHGRAEGRAGGFVTTPEVPDVPVLPSWEIDANAVSYRIFDAVYYLERHPELASTIGTNADDLYRYWVDNGIAQGQVASPVFDPVQYLAINSDVAGVFGNDLAAATNHFLNYGIYEGRTGVYAFDYTVYAYCNTDVAAVFGNDIVGYYFHYVKYGRAEGRTAQ